MMRQGCGIAFASLCLLAAGCGEATVTTPSGLKYGDAVVGKGEAAKAGDFVEVHYTGWLQADDTQFESSHDAKTPFTFRLGIGQVIKGWDEGIVGMKPGGKRKLWVPAKLGYGNQNRGLLLPANSDLLFEVELLRIIDGFKAEDIRAGTGKEVQWQDVVEVRYKGWLKDGGKEFDSNYDQAAPFVFGVGVRQEGLPQVIKGWEGGVVGMKVGTKRRLTIPAELAYGKRGSGEKIPPDADLVFDVELINILK